MPSSATVISRSTPSTGEGISVSTLSVETSSNASSTATLSPICFSQRVTVPSVTLSPSAGRMTETLLPDPAGTAVTVGAGVGISITAGASTTGAATGSTTGADVGADEPSASPIIASAPPTRTTASSPATISSNTPETGDGISVSTLSVETSSNGSSALMVSPTCLSQRVTVPSVTLSPSWGMDTVVVTSDVTPFSRSLG